MDLFFDLTGFDISAYKISNSKTEFRVYNKGTQVSKTVNIEEEMKTITVNANDNSVMAVLNTKPKKLVEFKMDSINNILSVDMFDYNSNEHIESILSVDFNK